MSESLPPIPSPPSHLWRQIRLQYLPAVVFVFGVAAAAVLWSRWVAPPSVIGEAEVIRSDVRSTHPGRLTSTSVQILQSVRAGDVLGQVITADPAVVEASLAVARAELDSIRYTMNPVAGQQRAALDYERLLLDLMSARVTLASLQAQLFQAQSNLSRTTTLFESKLVTEEKFEEVRNTRDALDAQVKAQLELIARVEPGLKIYASDGAGGDLPTAVQGLRAALKVQEEKLRLTEAQLKPVVLTAPIDGIVSQIFRSPGEVVAAAEPIFQVVAQSPARIIGFVRQPVGTIPSAGMNITVRTRTLERTRGSAKVLLIGEQLEPITPTLLAAMRLPVSNLPTELGLRLYVSVPKGLKLRPGEAVDLFFEN